jgi:hypothetical protein
MDTKIVVDICKQTLEKTEGYNQECTIQRHRQHWATKNDHK